MSYAAAREGLQARLETLKRTHGVAVVLSSPPANIHNDPFVYHWFDRFTNITTGPMNGNDYEVAIVVGVKWQDNDKAEQELAALVDALPRLFYAQQTNELGEYTTARDDTGETLPSLGGLSLNATLTGGATDRFPAPDFPWRTVRWTLRIREKGIT